MKQGRLELRMGAEPRVEVWAPILCHLEAVIKSPEMRMKDLFSIV